MLVFLDFEASSLGKRGGPIEVACVFEDGRRDGKWLSALLRAANLPRHALRLHKSDEAQREIASSMLEHTVDADRLPQTVGNLVGVTTLQQANKPPHRALPDAQGERALWLAVKDAAQAMAQGRSGQE